MFQLKNIKNIGNYYQHLYKYDINLYNLICIKILYAFMVYQNSICERNYEYDLKKEIFADVILYEIYKESQFYYSLFNFEHIIIKNIQKTNTRKLIITNYALVLYNYDVNYNKQNNDEKSDVILFFNQYYTDDINKYRVMKYKTYPTINNIYSTHSKADYTTFLQNILNGNDLNNAIPDASNKYDFISCHYNYIYGLNQTASIRGNLELPQYISTIAVALKYLDRGGTLVIFSTIVNTKVPSYRKLVGLLAHAFQKVDVVSSDINQNILIGVPEFYFKCTDYKGNISDGLLEKLIQCGIDTLDNVYNACNVMDWLDYYIEHEPTQTLFYKSSSSNKSRISESRISKSRKKIVESSSIINQKSLRISQFLAGNKNSKPSRTQKTKKTSKSSKSWNSGKHPQYTKQAIKDLYYINDIDIPELNAFLEDESTGFRVMLLCNQIETLYIGFFDIVNYHIENSIEYNAKGVPKISELAIKQKTVSNLRRVLEFLEYNRLPYNRHALAVLQEKQDDLLESFYNLFAPIESRIIHYNDSTSKRLERRGWDNLGLGAAYSLQSIEQHFQGMEHAYRVQQNLLGSLGLDKLPSKVQYATEDMTRGLAKFIMKRFETSLPHPVISNAFIKMWECLTASGVIPAKLSKGGRYRVFHICEAPGQMILAARYFAEKKCRDITDYDWRANSLNPYNAEVKRQYGAVFSDTYGLMRGNPTKWIWGGDGTGDITRVANVKWYRQYIKNEFPDLNLIIGDGGLGSGSDTLVLQRLDLAQVVMVLGCSRVGGACVIKHFTPFMPNHPESRNATSFFIGYMYLYYLAFGELSLFKPYSSDMTSGEFYVIGKGFRGLGQDETGVLTRLYSVLEKFEANQSIFRKDEIPETFKIQIAGFIKQMTDYNVMGYEKANLVLTCYKELERQKGQKWKLNFSDDSRNQSRKKLEKYLRCGDFLDEDKIEEILVPRYNKWVKMYKFV